MSIVLDGTTGVTTPDLTSGPITATVGAFSGDLTITDKIVHSGDTNTAIRFPTADTVTFETSGVEAIRIDASGNFLVGTAVSTVATQKSLQYIASAGAVRVNHSTASPSGDQFIGFFYNGGSAIGSITQNGTTSTSYNTSSDYRLKENVTPMQNALDTVAQLNPVTYTWKADGSAGQGFIAHELQAVVPDCVTGEKDAVDSEGNPQYQGVDTSFLVATLVKATQELTARVAELESAQ